MPSDGHISYGGTRYSVDPQAVGRTVRVRPEGEEVGELFWVYLGDVPVARHQRRVQGHAAVTLPEHAAALRQLTRAAPRQHIRRKGRRPRFEQRPPEPVLALTAPPPRAAHPDLEVQVRSLEVYEDLLIETSQEVLA